MAEENSIFPWDEWMAFGFGVLRLSPDSFWHMTPKELKAAIKGFYGPVHSFEALPRTRLKSLIKQFPD